MNGSSNGYGNFFASADFSDSDAGAGGSLNAQLTSSTDYIKISEVMENLLDSTTNLLQNNLYPDNPETVEKLSKIRQNLVSYTNSGLFMQFADFTKPIEDSETYVKVKSIIAQLGRDGFNQSSVDMYRDLLIDISGNNYENEIVNYKEQESAIVSLLDEYTKSVDALFKAEDSIKNKLSGYDDLAKRLDIVLSLDFNEAMTDVYKSILNYIAQFLKDNHIYESFMAYINARRKFIMYRKLLKMKENHNVGSDEKTLPECSICMTNPISHAFVPCGHAYCRECVTKQIMNCFTCRCKINQRMKLYI